MRARVRWALIAAVLLPGLAGASTAATPRAETKESAEDTPWLTDLRVRYGLATLEQHHEDGSVTTTRTDSATLLFSFGYEFDERFGVTVFVPFVLGALRDEDGTRRGAAAFGNLAAEASFRFRPTENLLLEPRGLLALPTARGDESGTPEEVDRFLLLRGAGFSQGSQEMALFEGGRLGGEVALLALWTPGRFLLRGWLKIEAMFDVRGDLKDPAIVESVGGLVVGYELGAGFRASLGLTYNRPWTAHEPKRFEAGTLDPALEWRRGIGSVALMAVLPIFGNSTLAHTFGLSLGGALRF
ncbi:MAG: hypothetical protein AB1938_30855 [Myxococcota bacterium]